MASYLARSRDHHYTTSNAIKDHFYSSSVCNNDYFVICGLVLVQFFFAVKIVKFIISVLLSVVGCFCYVVMMLALSMKFMSSPSWYLAGCRHCKKPHGFLFVGTRSIYLTSCLGQLNMAVPLWIAAVNTGIDHSCRVIHKPVSVA